MIKFLLAIAFLMPGAAFAQIDWRCGPSDTRFGRFGEVLYAYCFGTDDEKLHVRRRVVHMSSVTAEMEQEARKWLQGASNVWEKPFSTQEWQSPRMLNARIWIQSEIKREIEQGTAPVIRPWKVSDNPLSKTDPPTRPMFLATDTSKTVPERAVVGAYCNCKVSVLKGTLTLCPLKQIGTVIPTTNLTACTK